MDNPYEASEEPRPAGRIDELVFGRLERLGMEPARVCSDAVFHRRAFLDVIGTLPTAAETLAFLNDSSSARRAVLVDRLLARREFADYWAMKWSDLLRIRAEFPVNLWPNGAQAYYRWVHTAMRDNLRYDRFARELLVSNGGNFDVGQANFYRAALGRDPASIARAVALVFMGARTEKWGAARLAAMSAFFANVGYKKTGQWKEEIVFFDPDKAPPSGLPAPIFPDGTMPGDMGERDPRAVFADWLARPGNPWFAPAIANRVWCWLLGRGIVHEPDDFRPDNPPSNPDLLYYLAGELASSGYNLRALFRLILNSTTYQLSTMPRSERPEAAVNFAYYPLRRLEAEVLIDGIDQITGTTESYTSAVPEPYTVIPDGRRAIALEDGSVTSSFLVMFGRPARNTGLESERIGQISAAQRLYLLNSTEVQRKIQQGPRIGRLLQAAAGVDDGSRKLYLEILSRPPTAEELETVGAYMGAAWESRRMAGADVAWALINSAEFLYRH